MKKNFKRIFAAVLSISLVMGFTINSAEASYDRDAAANYALRYAEDSNSVYYEFDSDCTNFVSQCEAVGGVVSYINYDFTEAPSVLKKYILDNDANYWYMIKRTRAVGFDYWQYSKTWAVVRDFRGYFQRSNCPGSNNIADVMSLPIQNASVFCGTAQLGDVIQYDENGNSHSVIITYKGSGSTKYSAHTNNKKNADLKEFLNYAENRGISTIWKIHYK